MATAMRNFIVGKENLSCSTAITTCASHPAALPSNSAALPTQKNFKTFYVVVLAALGLFNLIAGHITSRDKNMMLYFAEKRSTH